MKEYKSRKFILAMLTLLIVTALVWFHAVSDVVYSAVVIATVGAYITGNITEKVVTK